MTEPDEEPLGRTIGTSLSDYAVIGFAALFALGGLYLMFGPSPMAPLYAQKKQAEQAQQTDEQQPQSEPGEVSIDLKNWQAPPKR